MHVCVRVCTRPAEDTLSLEASDQREASREASPVYTSDREGWVATKDQWVYVDAVALKYTSTRVCVCVGRSIVPRAVHTLQDIPEAQRERAAAAESPG